MFLVVEVLELYCTVYVFYLDIAVVQRLHFDVFVLAFVFFKTFDETQPFMCVFTYNNYGL